jgi:predicted DNA-binding transcriptional regulator YafY
MPGDSRDKVARLWELRELLERKARTTAELAEHLDVPMRTVQRDLETLRTLGVDIEQPKRAHYRIAAQPTTLNAVEALAVHAATRLLYHHAPVRSRYYQSAMEKLAQMLPEPARSIAFRSAEDVLAKPGSDRTLELAARAWFEGRILAFDYLSPTGSGTPRPKALEVYFIEISRGNLAPYAIGYERSFHKRVLTWKLSRMQNVRLLMERYTIPADFDPKDYLSTAWGVIGSSGGPTVTAQLRFSAEAASRVDEGGYPNLAVVERYSDGSIDVQVQVGSDDSGFPLELLSWAQSWGSRVEVLAPENLRQRWLEEARQVVTMTGDLNETGHL